MSKSVLLPKGMYVCSRCEQTVQVFVRVFEVNCPRHGQMSVKPARATRRRSTGVLGEDIIEYDTL